MVTVFTYLFLILRILSNPVANLFQKKLSTEFSSISINFYSYLFLSFFCLPFYSKYISLNLFSFEFVICVILAGLLCATGTLCTIKAINIGELSVIGPINSYKSIIGLISAFVFLSEIPSLVALFGVLLIIFGSRFLFDIKNDSFSFSLFKRKDIQLRFLALLLTGIEAAILKKIILLSSVEVCFLFWCFTGLFWCFVFLFVSKKTAKITNKNHLFQLLLIAVCLGLMQYSTNYVFFNMNVGYALALFQLSSLVTVFFGYKFFNEKNFFKKIVGTLIMLFGSVLILFFNN